MLVNAFINVNKYFSCKGLPYLYNPVTKIWDMLNNSFDLCDFAQFYQ